MPKRRIQGLQTALMHEFSQPQVWALHEPALTALLDVALGASGQQGLTFETVLAKLGMASSDPVSTQMVGQVAVLPIFGVLSQKSNWMTRYLGWTATETLERDFKEAAANSQVKAIVMYCDSPGGNALGNEEVSRVVYAARGAKPVVTYVRGLCCSAGYYLGSAASKVYASPSSLIGSIGAVSTHIEFSKALADMGIAATVVRSAPHKQLWNQFEKLGPEAKATLQKFVSDYGSQFEAAVAKHRGVTAGDVKAKFGQGDAFIAAEAAQRGLIDGVVSWETLLAKLQTGGPLPNISGDDGNDSAVARKQIFTYSTANGSLAAGWSEQEAAAYAGLAVQGLGGLADSFAPAIAASGSSLELSALEGQGLGANSHAEAPRRRGEEMKISAKVRAALFARGLIQAADASEDICLAARDAYFAARGEACPQEDDKTCAALFAAAPQAAAQVATLGTSLQAAQAVGATHVQQNNVVAAHEREVAEARAEARKDEVSRQKEIRASAKLLNLDEAAVTEAIDSGKPYAEIVTAWHGKLSATEKPITPRADVKVGEEGASRYVADAVLATMIHFGQGEHVPKEKITPQVEQLSRAPLYVHALKCLQAANIRVFDEHDREAVCEAAFEMDAGRQIIRADGGIPYNRPGSFPNLLSGLANKLFDEEPDDAETSFEEYTGVWPGDLPDFKPVPVVSKGRIGELDEVLDAEEFKEQGLSEECLSHMQLSRFGNKAGLTPVLAANDDLGAFMDDMWGLNEGWLLTQNRGCLRLITSNAYLLDGTQLFDDTNHLNHVSSGGAAPTDSEWDNMAIKASKQTTIGGKSYAAVSLGVILCPPKLWRGASQSFWKFNSIGESKEAATDTNLSVYRGMVTVVKDPELAATSEVEWYAMTRPGRKSPIVRAYFRGFGRAGKRERWYDPNTKTYWISLEGRFGAAVRQYRYIYKNKGAA